MSDYITNSKNRKLKTKILLFLSRINIGAGTLPISGRVIILMEIILGFSLFFPWLTIVYSDGGTTTYYAFSQFLLYIGYLLICVISLIPFFLLSHTKKEQIRAMLPFRLSDTQAIVFVTTILSTMLVDMIIMNGIYSSRIAQSSSLGSGFKMAIASVVCIFIASYFLSSSTKIANTDIYYIDHSTDDELLKYKYILDKNHENSKKNMSLPI